nr:hypothetical protein [Gammaproteobacteria bacterium]
SAPKSTSLSVKEKKYQRFFMVGDALKLAIILGQCLLVKLFAAHVDVVTLQKEMEECHIGCYKNVRNVGETLAILQAEINQKESLKVPSISVFDQNTANEGENHSNSEINGVSP